MPFAKGSETVAAVKGKKGSSVVWKCSSSAVWGQGANHQTCSKVCLRATSAPHSSRLSLSISKIYIYIFEIIYSVVFHSFTKIHNWSQRAGFQGKQTKTIMIMILFVTRLSCQGKTDDDGGWSRGNKWEVVLAYTCKCVFILCIECLDSRLSTL